MTEGTDRWKEREILLFLVSIHLSPLLLHSWSHGVSGANPNHLEGEGSVKTFRQDNSGPVYMKRGFSDYGETIYTQMHRHGERFRVEIEPATFLL